MKVKTTISRWDLLRFNFYLAPRLKANWIAVAVMASLGFIYLSLTSPDPFAAGVLARNLFSGLVGGIGGLLAGTAVCLVFLLLTASSKSGVLGEHEFEITPDGLLERTAANEGLNKWGGIFSVAKSPMQIYVRINSYLCHVIPRHGFSSDTEYEQFYRELHDRWRSSAG